MTRRRLKPLGVPATLALIAAAFPDEKLDAVASFPLGTTYLERDEIVASTHKKLWSRVGWEALERNHESPHFATPAGLAAYLPAYLTVVVRDYALLDMLPNMVCGALTMRDERQRQFLLFVAHVTDEQKRAIAWALVQIEELWGPDRECPPRRALDSFWRSYAT